MTINIMTRMRALNFDLSLNYDFKGKIPKKQIENPIDLGLSLKELMTP